MIGCLEDAGHDISDSMLLLERDIRDVDAKTDRFHVRTLFQIRSHPKVSRLITCICDLFLGQ